MKRRSTLSVVLAAACLLVANSVQATPAQTAQDAQKAYLAAINSNDLERFLATVTPDIIFIAPGAPVMTGQGIVGAWVDGYFGAVKTVWQKSSDELVVAGDWAFDRYTYRVIDIPKAGGPISTGSGNGINIYRRDVEGVWRVARDVWNAAPTLVLAPVCNHAPC